MNLKKQSKQLEEFLDDEFKRKPPIAVLPNGNLAYKECVVKKNKDKMWQVYHSGRQILDAFNLKVCAIMAAKLYSNQSLRNYHEIRNLDSLYQNSKTDADRFSHRCKTVKDYARKDTYAARLIEADSRVQYAKSQIRIQFKMLFWSTTARLKIAQFARSHD